jgi:uncharacterized protein
MRTKLIDDPIHDAGAASQQTYALIFNTGDQVVSGLKTFAGEQHLAASHFTAIGAFQDVTLSYFDWEKKDYIKIPIREQVEVLSLVGDITISDGKPISMPMLSLEGAMVQPVAAILSKLKYVPRSR